MRQDEGRTVVWVRLGATVCERIEVEQFDAVLRDLGLPDVDGIALLRELRMMAGSPAKAALPVIILSSRDGLEERLRGFHAGADDYLVKPFDISEQLARCGAAHAGRGRRDGRLRAGHPGHDAGRPGQCAVRRQVHGWVRWSESDAASGIRLERMHEVDDEWMLTRSGLRYLLSPTIASLPFLLIIALGVIRIGLGPLRVIAAAIESRAGADLSALPSSPYRELTPLIEPINRLMARLRLRLRIEHEHEHEFLSDVAHELKTPLAAIRINAHLLCARLDKLVGTIDAGQGLRDGVGRGDTGQ